MENRELHYGDLDYAQASLIGACEGQTPDVLRAVYGWFKDDKIVLFYLVDRPVSENQAEDLRCISTEVVSDFVHLGLEESWGTKAPQLPDEMFKVGFEPSL